MTYEAIIHAAIAAVCPIDGISIQQNGEVSVQVNASATQEQRDAAQAAIASARLAAEKSKKCDAIDARTRDLFDRGVSFNGKTMSLSDKAQLNWSILQGQKDGGRLVYPVIVSTLDQSFCSFESGEDLQTFLNLAVQTGLNNYGSGLVLKMRVQAASTIDEVESITDDR